MARPLLFYALALLVGLLTGLAINLIAFGAPHAQALFAALGVTALHGGLVFVLLGKSDAKKSHFLLRGLCIHGIRIVLVVAAVLLARALGGVSLLPFVASVMAGYLCVLFAEVASLYLGTRYTDIPSQ